MADLKRYVIGNNENGKSTILHTGVPNQQEKEGFYWRSTMWKTAETPVDNSIPGDRSTEGGAARSPFPNGMLVRCLELWPDQDQDTMRTQFAEANEMVGQKHQASESELARNAMMHKTDTLDVITCVRGEVYIILDEEEILLKPTDTVVIKGSNHGWSNRSDEPCLLIGTMTDALPR